MSPQSAIKRGALIIIEGADRVGKTTQAVKLVDRLRADGDKADLMRFPDRTTAIGQMINSYLKGEAKLDDHAIHLLFSANRWELVEKINKSLVAGISLIVDRYAYSGVAYSASKDVSLNQCVI